MRGIQVMYVSPSGATQESDDLVKDLENWFEDHRQLCRLMTMTAPQDVREVAPGLDRLCASVDSGQRLFGRLKHSVQGQDSLRLGLQRGGGRIPLSGMNRFEESAPLGPASQPAANSFSRSSSTTAQQSPAHLQTNFVALSNSCSTEVPRVLPSRTYLKKNGNGS